MSYGIAPYGISPYGCVVADLSIANAVAVSTHVVRVTFTKEPQAVSPSLVGDVLNPRTWEIIRGDTSQGFTVLIISKVSNLVWDIRVLEKFASKNVAHTVSSGTLLDEGGSLIDLPRDAQFAGVIAAADSTPERVAVQRKQGIRDLNNPVAPSGTNSVSGSLVISSDGDYQLHDGPDFIRKLIFRRLTTGRGAFWHLPNYGLGLKVKQPVPGTELVKLKAEIERQIKLEPEVTEVRATIRQSGNALNIVVLAVLAPTGQQVSFPLQVPFG